MNNKKRQWFSLAFIAISVAVIVPQFHVLRASLKHLHHLNYGLLLLAFGAVVMTFVTGALVYKILAFRKLSYRRTVIAQVAANFINRLLPAGIGGIGLNYKYLRKQKHNAAQAASVVTANNSLGIIGNLLLVAVLTIVFHAHAVPLKVNHKTQLIILAVLALLILVVAAVPRLKKRIVSSLKSFAAQLQQYRKRPAGLAAALAVQLLLTISNVTAFWLCVLAVHASLTFVAALLVFTFGFGVGAAAPTPGGLGGVEAGLAAGLVAYHIANPTALAAVLVYRLVSYWLPLAISGLVFIYATRQHYFN